MKINARIALVAMAVSAVVLAAPATAAEGRSDWRYPLERSHLLIQYTLGSEDIPDSGHPRLMIYGDGTVMVRPHLNPAGNLYQAHLEPYELEELLRFLEQRGVFTLSTEDFKELQKAAEREDPRLPWVSTRTMAIIEVHLSEYRDGTGRFWRPLDNTLTLDQLSLYAEVYPAERTIQDLDEASRKLDALSRQDGLIPVERVDAP